MRVSFLSDRNLSLHPLGFEMKERPGSFPQAYSHLALVNRQCCFQRNINDLSRVNRIVKR